MTTESRDVTMSIQGVQLLVTVLTCHGSVHQKPPRRWCTRLPGSKQMIDEILADSVLAEIDRRLVGEKLEVAEEECFPPRGLPIELLGGGA
jgi:hypothetical protein